MEDIVKKFSTKAFSVVTEWFPIKAAFQCSYTMCVVVIIGKKSCGTILGAFNPTGHAHSRMDLTLVTCRKYLTLNGHCFIFIFRKPKTLLVWAVTLLTWGDKFSVNNTPRYLASLTLWMGLPSMLCHVRIVFHFFVNTIWLHFWLLYLIFQVEHHFYMWPRSACSDVKSDACVCFFTIHNSQHKYTHMVELSLRYHW